MQIAECGHEFISTEPVCRFCGKPMLLAEPSVAPVGRADGDRFFRKLALGVLSASAFLGLGLTTALVILGTGGGRKAHLDLVTPSDLKVARENAQQVIADQSSRLIPGAPEAKAMVPSDAQDGGAPSMADAHSTAGTEADAEDADSGDGDTDPVPAGKSHVRIVVHQVSAAPISVGGEAAPLNQPPAPMVKPAAKILASPPVAVPAPVPAPAPTAMPPVVEINGNPPAH